MRRAPLITADKFKTTKDADAIADFYSTEDFLQILGIFPMAIHFVLAGVDWDPKRENTMKVWDSMQISFDITEKEEIIDGKTAVTMFNKRRSIWQRFRRRKELRRSVEFGLFKQRWCLAISRYPRMLARGASIWHGSAVLAALTAPIHLNVVVHHHLCSGDFASASTK